MIVVTCLQIHTIDFWSILWLQIQYTINAIMIGWYVILRDNVSSYLYVSKARFIPRCSHAACFTSSGVCTTLLDQRSTTATPSTILGEVILWWKNKHRFVIPKWINVSWASEWINRFHPEYTPRLRIPWPTSYLYSYPRPMHKNLQRRSKDLFIDHRTCARNYEFALILYLD